MFLRAFVEIRVPAPAAAEVLRQLPQTLIQSFAVDAVAHGQAILANVGFPIGAHRLHKQVEIELGDPVETPSRTWLPLAWKAIGAEAFLPSLEGELEAAALGEELTQIGLSARYKPPLGGIGAALDRLFLHRIAEATVRDFMQRIADAIEDGVALMQRPTSYSQRRTRCR